MKLTFRKCLGLSLATGLMGLFLALPERGVAQNNRGSGIKLVVPNGTYVFRDSGYLLPAYPSLQPLVPLEAAGQETYFANGTLTGLVSFSLGGKIYKMVPLKGTFTVNADGSQSQTVIQQATPNFTLHFDGWLTPDGNTLTFVATDPGSIVSGIATRGSPTGDGRR